KNFHCHLRIDFLYTSRVKRLAQRIASDLEKSKISAIYNSELARVFPKTISPKERQEMIRRFAMKHGLDVDIFEVGLCAIFEKTASRVAEPGAGNKRGEKRSFGKKPPTKAIPARSKRSGAG